MTQARTVLRQAGMLVALVAALLWLSTPAHAQDRRTTLLIQNMSNTTLRVVQTIATSGKFLGEVPTEVGPSDQIVVTTINDNLLTGCSGVLGLQPEHGKGFIVIKWDNPYIGSNSYDFSEPGGWDVFGIRGKNGDDGSGNWASLTIRIEGRVNLAKRDPDINLDRTGPGIVRGRVLWPTSYGAPTASAVLPRSATPGPARGGPWRFFQLGATAPGRFQPYAGKDSLTATYYQGRWGEYVDPLDTGRLAVANLPVPVPGFDGFAFTISNLPVGVPITLSVAPAPDVAWRPPKPLNVAARAPLPVQPLFYCVATDPEADLTPKMYDLSGFDFTVTAEWVSVPSSSSPGPAVVQATAGASKSTVQFGTVDAATLAAITRTAVEPARTILRPPAPRQGARAPGR